MPVLNVVDFVSNIYVLLHIDTQATEIDPRETSSEP